MLLIRKHNDGFSSSLVRNELITTPAVLFRIMIFQSQQCPFCIVSLLYMALKTTMDWILERIFKGQREITVRTLDFEDNSTDDSPVSTPWHGHSSSWIK